VSTETPVPGGHEGCYVGELRLFAGNFAPAGTVFADGQLLKISLNTALFSILGTTYGGDGVTTFALPDLHDLGPGGTSYVICLVGIFPARN
jgi:microcystin-dependent protein